MLNKGKPETEVRTEYIAAADDDDDDYKEEEEWVNGRESKRKKKPLNLSKGVHDTIGEAVKWDE